MDSLEWQGAAQSKKGRELTVWFERYSEYTLVDWEGITKLQAHVTGNDC